MFSFGLIKCWHLIICYCSAIPASALDEDEEEEEDEVVGEMRDDERTGTRYNVSCFPSICSTH